MKKQKTSRKSSNNLIPGAKTKIKGEQPTPEQKKAGRERKRQAQAMMDLVLRYGAMTKPQIEKMLTNKDSLTMLESLMLKYVSGGLKDNKILIDFINRHVPYAPTKTELTGEDGQSLTINIL